ncbi:MAG TPA: hypothetical protein VKX28_17670 [Xanthobacteraceae bacterium]|nr:hypothetical protein [Xanthobacteraceae bacterium]
MWAALALLVALPAGAAALADYGEMVCRQYGAKIPIDCACAGAPLQAEYDEDELVMIIQFVNNANDPNAKFEELMELEKKFGKDKLEDLGKRFERLAEADMKACMKK